MEMHTYTLCFDWFSVLKENLPLWSKSLDTTCFKGKLYKLLGKRKTAFQTEKKKLNLAIFSNIFLEYVYGLEYVHKRKVFLCYGNWVYKLGRWDFWHLFFRLGNPLALKYASYTYYLLSPLFESSIWLVLSDSRF